MNRPLFNSATSKPGKDFLPKTSASAPVSSCPYNTVGALPPRAANPRFVTPSNAITAKFLNSPAKSFKVARAAWTRRLDVSLEHARASLSATTAGSHPCAARIQDPCAATRISASLFSSSEEEDDDEEEAQSAAPLARPYAAGAPPHASLAPRTALASSASMHRSDAKTNPSKISFASFSFVAVVVDSVLLGAYTAHRRIFIDVIGVVVIVSFVAARGIAWRPVRRCD
jgi:hypothetical protein